jgi:hypothetical protein
VKSNRKLRKTQDLLLMRKDGIGKTVLKTAATFDENDFRKSKPSFGGTFILGLAINNKGNIRGTPE